MDEREFIAAERALGVEPIPRMGEAPADIALRREWEQRLAPMLAAIAPVEPPAIMLTRIEKDIDAMLGPTVAGAASGGFADAPGGSRQGGSGPGGSGAEIIPLRRALRTWKAVAVVAMAAAAALMLYIAVPGLAPMDAPAARYVAIVTADDGGEAGLIINIDTGSGVATVIPVAAPPDGKSYEMWTIPEGETTPVSLGLLPQEAVARVGLDAAPGQLFAISLEQEGGSPTGQPTDARYHGRVVKVE